MLVLATARKQGQGIQMETSQDSFPVSFSPSVPSPLVLPLSVSPWHIIRMQTNLFSAHPCTFVSSYSTNRHDLEIMELGQHSHFY